jgi:hypothetical protein
MSPRDVTRRLIRHSAPLCGSQLRQVDAAAALGAPAARDRCR